MSVDGGGRLTKLAIDPILVEVHSTREQNTFFFLSLLQTLEPIIILSHIVHISYLDGHFVLGEGSAPKQLVDTVNGEESCDVST